MKGMNDLMEKFIKYAVFDDAGDLVGVKENAPKEALEAFDEYSDLIRKAHDEGVVI